MKDREPARQSRRVFLFEVISAGAGMLASIAWAWGPGPSEPAASPTTRPAVGRSPSPRPSPPSESDHIHIKGDVAPPVHVKKTASPTPRRSAAPAEGDCVPLGGAPLPPLPPPSPGPSGSPRPHGKK